MEYVKRDCRFFPTLYDFHRLRPKSHEPNYAGPAVAFENIPTQPGSWGEFVVQTCSKYIKRRDMVGMYQALIAEMERRNMRQDEFHGGRNVGITGMREALARAKAVVL